MKTTALATGMLLTLTASVPALACPTKGTGTLQQAVNAWLASKDIPAGAMCVAAVKNGTGYATCDGEQQPGINATTDTLFQIGSVTKTFTGTLLAKRVSQGSLSMNSVFLGTNVTLQQVATHTSGLPENSFLTGNITPNPADGTLSDFYWCVDHPSSCPFNPSQGWLYSNFGFAALGFGLADFDGYDGDWPTDIDESVLDQLEMWDTQVYERWVANKPLQFVQDAAHGYQYDDNDGWESVGSAPHPRCPAHNPSGCLYASTRDMRLWLRYHMGLTTPGTALGNARDLIRGQAYNYGSQGIGWDFSYNSTCQGTGNWTVVSKGGSVDTQRAFIAYLQDPSAPYGVSPRGVVLLMNRDPKDEDFSLTDLGFELLQTLRP